MDTRQNGILFDTWQKLKIIEAELQLAKWVMTFSSHTQPTFTPRNTLVSDTSNSLCVTTRLICSRLNCKNNLQH